MNDMRRGARHEEMWEFIPWLVNGRLGASAAAELRAHLDECQECAHEYADQQRICKAMQPDGALAFASEASFQKLTQRLDAAPAERGERAPWRSIAAGFIVVALGLTAWGTWSVQKNSGANAPYRTLTSPAPMSSAGAQLRVVFAPDLPVAELAGLLRSIDASIIAGPTEAGVYTLGFTPSLDSSAQVAQRLALLRANERVRFAEPVAAAQ